jgi:ferredoxin-like protein FixX
MSTYLFKLNTNSNSNSNSNSNVIAECTNGCPKNFYANNPNIEPAKSENMLYSIYQSYQSTPTVQYLKNNHNYLTNPDNFVNLPPGPANIFITRHGVSNSSSYCLDCNGAYIACNYANFINKLTTSGYPIFCIVTCYPGSNLIINPQQTVSPAAFLLNIPVFSYSTNNVSQKYDSNNAQTVLQLFTNPLFIGKNVSICWEHTNIQGLCNQIVQCQQYLANGHTTTDLINNFSDVLDSSTEDWWSTNSPIPSNLQFVYSNVNPPISAPPDSLPYCDPNKNIDYSQYLPYWNKNNYNTVYKFTQSIDYNLSFQISIDSLKFCYTNCDLYIGMVQYNNMESYKGEGKCETP